MFYIETKTNPIQRFTMDIERNISFIMSGKPTQYRTQGEYDSSDHYHEPFDKLSVSGKIGKVKFSTGGRTTTDYNDFVTGMTTLKRSRKKFRCSFSDDLSVLQDCLFLALSFNWVNTDGIYMLNVDMEIQDTRESQQAGFSDLTQFSDDYKAILSPRSSGKQYAVEPPDDSLTATVKDLTGIDVSL